MSKATFGYTTLQLHAVTVSCLAVVALSTVACRTTNNGGSTTGESTVKTKEMASSAVTALPINSYDLATLKAHLNYVKSDELKNKQLWALVLKEPEADAACPGLVTETYYFADVGDNNTDGYPVVTAKPMPMNGPCGFLMNSEMKRFSEIGGDLMESTPMRDIGTFDKIRVSIKQAISLSQHKYKTFKYSQGVKIYRHLHPDMWSYPWYAIYGESCGVSATVIMNATTGGIVPNMEAPAAECP